MNIFIAYRIRSRKSKNEGSVYDQDYIPEKLSDFCCSKEMLRRSNPFYKKEKKIQEAIK